MANQNLSAAKTAKNDEFYTQYSDIQKEINAYIEYNPDVFKDKTILLPCDDPEWSNFTKFFAQNFAAFGLKKLISTSYAVESKTYKYYQPSLFETESPLFDADKTLTKGKIFTLTADENKDGRIDINDLKWSYMEGDGDFRSAEVKKLRDETDIIITNPPFSLFREFLAWIVETDKKFAIIGNKNAVTYKEVFPLIKENKIWTGKTEWAGGLWFETMNINDVDKVVDGKNMKNSPSVWFTNLDHGRRHQPLSLMTMADNIKFSKHKEIRGIGYQKYDNYDAIEVPFTDAIPSDYREIKEAVITEKCEENAANYLTNTIEASQLISSAPLRSAPLRSAPLRSAPRRSRTALHNAQPMRGLSSGARCNGIMGVPISFLDKYCPEQFEIIGLDRYVPDNPNYGHRFTIGGRETYARILIKHKV
ncbi:adenine-specific methyltransferase EcoRI family protein [Treponema vincentii]|uniref:adenine-specific methyltransferase EcoRI family protein n=1 Tax=Treponema vincentii TaxID=69710 RepID=UPI0020A2ED6B|nr:adenine-specific methyltransferase EcoRI family protein [Treponema vincentii]